MGIPYDIELQEYKDALKDTETNIKELEQKIEVLQEENLKLQVMCNEKEKVFRGGRVMDYEARENEFNKQAVEIYEDFHDKVYEHIDHNNHDDGRRYSYNPQPSLIKTLSIEEMNRETLNKILIEYENTYEKIAKLHMKYFPEEYENLDI